MTMSRHSTGNRLAISSISLGWHATHTLPRKLRAAAAAGYAGIEIFMWDLQTYANSEGIAPWDAAQHVRSMCVELGLQVVSLASLDNFEGMGAKTSLQNRLNWAKMWVELARVLATGDEIIVQVPSAYAQEGHELFRAGKESAEAVVVEELRALADVAGPNGGASPRILFAYEFMPWSVVSTWQDCLRTVRAVDRSNFGLCIDTYHFISGTWADCRGLDGRAPNADDALQESLAGFVREVKREDVIYVQLSDAEYLSPPMTPSHEAWNDAKHPTEMWCTYGRLFPLEIDKGAYFPMETVCNAWLKQIGWEGWVSMETFHREMREATCGPEQLAERGVESWTKLKSLLSLE